MKQWPRLPAFFTILVFAISACQVFIGDMDDSPSDPTESSYEFGGGALEVDIVSREFPMAGDAFNVAIIGDGSLVYYTRLPSEDVMKFYRDEYAAKGYTERKVLPTITDAAFSMVFDGDPSNMAVVIRIVNQADGSLTVTIRLEDI